MSDSYPTYDASTGYDSEYPEMRIDAAVRMGRTDSKEHAGTLLWMLFNDGNARVRAAASSALENMDHDAVVRALESATKGRLPEQMLDYQLLAIKLLGRRRDRDSIKVLSDLLTRREREIRTAALRALEQIGGEAAAMAICETAVPRHAELEERLETLGRMKARCAVPFLVRVILQANWETTAAAIQALGRIGDPSVLRILQEAAGHDAAPVRYQAITALRRFDGTGAAPALCAACYDEEAGVRKAARDALGHLKLKESTVFLCEALAFQSERLRRAAFDRLSHLRDPAAAPYLFACLEDDDGEIRDAARLALSKLEVGESLPLISPLLGTSKGLRLGAVRRMGKLGDSAAVPMLLPLLSDAEASMRAAAAQALGRLRVPEAAPAVAKLLPDPDVSARLAAAQALGVLRNRTVLPALRERVKTFGGEPDVSVRIALKHALRQLEAETADRAALPLTASEPAVDSAHLPRPTE